MNPKEDDQYWIAQVLRGNQAAYEPLVDKYQHTVFAMVRRIIRDDDEACDVAQTVFIKAFEKLSSFGNKSQFSTWLHSIAYNTAISAYRKKKPIFVAVDEWDGRKFATVGGEDEASEKETMLQRLEDVLRLLPAEDQLLVHLFYTAGHSIAEMSEMTGYSIANLKVKLFRIRKKLQEMMENVTQAQYN